MNRVEYPIHYEDLDTTRRYTDKKPTTYQWYTSTQPTIWMDLTQPLEVRRAFLDAYCCDWDLSYKTLDAVEANRTPYSYKVLTAAAKTRILSQ